MNIHLNKPYKIIAHKHKRYDAHYKIVSLESLVVPLKVLGTEVSCDVRWENENGELKMINNAMFSIENLIPVNEMADDRIYDLWTHYYQPDAKRPLSVL